jgi:hypothetical protein
MFVNHFFWSTSIEASRGSTLDLRDSNMTRQLFVKRVLPDQNWADPDSDREWISASEFRAENRDSMDQYEPADEI